MCLCEPKISLIIPVYNVENFIKKTLDSALNQTFKDYEIILINDGSTDKSLSILKEYENKYKNIIRIIDHGDNKGVGNARNSGIKAASGEYIAFLDSDDFIDPIFLEVLYKNSIENNADISCCNYYLYYEKSNKRIYMPFTAKTGIYSNQTALKKLILDFNFHFFLWNKLFKRSLFIDNDISFCDMYFEDVATCPQLFYYANKVSFVNKPLYYYRRHDKSIISTINAPKINDYIKSMGVIRNFLEKKCVYKKYKSVFKLYALRFKFQISYCILMDHLDKLNFSGMSLNLKKANYLINLFKSDEYIAEDLSDLPIYVVSPQKREKAIAR